MLWTKFKGTKGIIAVSTAKKTTPAKTDDKSKAADASKKADDSKKADASKTASTDKKTRRLQAVQPNPTAAITMSSNGANLETYHNTGVEEPHFEGDGQEMSGKLVKAFGFFAVVLCAFFFN